MKQKTSKFKRVVITALAAVCALSSVAAISAGAVSSSKSVPLKNGYTHRLSFNVGKAPVWQTMILQTEDFAV